MTRQTRQVGDKGRPRWRRRADARPHEILDAALAVFAEQGFARSRLDDVARRAGVTKGTVYLYFDSKEALFREVVKAKVGHSVTRGEEFVRTFQGPARELLCAFIERYWASLLQPDNAQLARLAMTEFGSFPDLLRFYLDEVVQRAHRLIASIIKQGVSQAEFRAVDPGFAAGALQTLCVHLARAQRFPRSETGPQRSDEKVIAGIIDLYFNGLLVAPTTADDLPKKVPVAGPRGKSSRSRDAHR